MAHPSACPHYVSVFSLSDTEYLGEGRIWKEYLGRHVEKVIKPLKAHARAARAAGHFYSGTSGASIKRLRPTPRRVSRRPAGRRCGDGQESRLRREGGRVEQIETTMSSQIASGQIRRRFRRMEGAPQNARCPRVLAQRFHEVEIPESRHFTRKSQAVQDAGCACPPPFQISLEDGARSRSPFNLEPARAEQSR